MARSYSAVLLLLLAAAAVVAAVEARNVTCPQQPLAPGRYEFSFEYEGLERYVRKAQARWRRWRVRGGGRTSVADGSLLVGRCGPCSRFLVYVPTTYTNNATAIFLNFHGYLTTMEFQYDLTGMEIVRSRALVHGALAAGSLAFSLSFIHSLGRAAVRARCLNSPGRRGGQLCGRRAAGLAPLVERRRVLRLRCARRD